jgi:ribosome-binding protein aMBF1 (putative translation factor)
MITNAKQYKISKAAARKFEEGLKAFEQEDHGNTPEILVKAQRDAIKSQLETLKEEIKEYEKLTRRETPPKELELIPKIPEQLIAARISRGWTQKELAEQVGLHTQKIQEYEKTRYTSVSLGRVKQIAQVLLSSKTRVSTARKAAAKGRREK